MKILLQLRECESFCYFSRDEEGRGSVRYRTEEMVSALTDLGMALMDSPEKKQTKQSWRLGTWTTVWKFYFK